jgi:hypothetical protein
MKPSETYPQLMASLDDLRRHWRARKLVEGVLLALAGLLVVLLATVAADNLLQLGQLGRGLLALLLWGTLLAGLVGLVVRRWLEDRRDDFFAALVEQKHPELHNRLINALQLGRGTEVGSSPRLIEAIVNDAAQATADLEMERSLEWRPAVRAAVLAVVAVLLLAGYAAARWPHFTTSLARVLLPVANIEPYTATKVTLLNEASKVAEGTPVLLAARVSGVVPDKARVHFQPEGGAAQEFDMQPTAQEEADARVFQFKVPQATRSFDYYVTAHDGRSRAHHIEVVKRPQIEKLALTYTPPPYTGLSPRHVAEADGEIGDIPGTTVTVQVTASKAIGKGQLIVRAAGQDPIALDLDRGPADNVWQASFVLWGKDLPDGPAAQALTGQRVLAPSEYQVRVWSTDGYDNLNPLWRPIALVKDQPPSVAIIVPGHDTQAKPGEVVKLTVEAHDDYGLDTVRVLARLNNDKQTEYELARFVAAGAPKVQATYYPELRIAASADARGFYPVTTAGDPANAPKLALKPGDRLEYWATVTDRNNVSGPGKAASRPFGVTLMTEQRFARNLDEQVPDFAEALENLLKLQRLNEAETSSGLPFAPLIKREIQIRADTQKLARRMEESALPLRTIVQALDRLAAAWMVEAVKGLESGRDAAEAEVATRHRGASADVQKKIIQELEALLLRLQRNEQAKQALRKIEKKDPVAYKKITEKLTQMIRDMDQLLKDQTELAGKFERMPKKTAEELQDEKMKLTKEMEELQRKWEKWAKGSVEELAKLPTGFVDDFNLRKDVNKVYEEIEKAAARSKAEKIEVSLEDMGVGLGTKMKEDLETWMPDSPDNVKWVMEEPLNKKTPKVPEMPLPKALEDLVGDLLQKADEFDQEADDITSAWGDNLDQAGWGVSDGPISSFSPKGKTGNDLPNSNEVTGRSGDGRRGKSSGQMVGDTARGLKGRKTPARVNNERYEPGQLKVESTEDPEGATGGGKKAGAGRKGLQGGSPPDPVKDIGRLNAKQAGFREKADQVAKKLETSGIRSSRLRQGIQLLEASEKDLRDLRYDDAFRKRKQALQSIRRAALEIDRNSGLQLSRSRELPPELRKELLQGADDGYPPGYEALLRNYYKELSKAEK